MKRRFIFVGEQRSDLAIKMNVRWEDGRLAAKQLFDALQYCDIDPKDCKFANVFENGEHGIRKVDLYGRMKGWVAVGMGKKVQNELIKLGIDFIPLVHPAARGKIRNKELYCKHVKEQLKNEN